MLFEAPIARFPRLFDGFSFGEASYSGHSSGFLYNTDIGGYSGAISILDV